MEKGNKQGFNHQVFKKAVKLSCGLDDLVAVQIFDAVVQAGTQNPDTMTCFVDSVDSTLNNLEVRYNLCISDGEINVPEDDSTVTIAKTAFTDPYIVKSSDLQSKLISIGTQSYFNNGINQEFTTYQDGVVGSYGGVIKDIDPTDPTIGLLAKINNLENLLNDLQTKFETWVPVANDGGAALKTILTVTTPIWDFPQIVLTKRTDLENSNLLHGTSNIPT